MDRKGKQKLKRYFIVYVIFAVFFTTTPFAEPAFSMPSIMEETSATNSLMNTGLVPISARGHSSASGRSSARKYFSNVFSAVPSRFLSLLTHALGNRLIMGASISLGALLLSINANKCAINRKDTLLSMP